MNTQAQSRSDAQPSFCKRELAVLRLLAKEQSSQQIGDTLSIETDSRGLHPIDHCQA